MRLWLLFDMIALLFSNLYFITIVYMRSKINFFLQDWKWSMDTIRSFIHSHTRCSRASWTCTCHLV